MIAPSIPRSTATRLNAMVKDRMQTNYIRIAPTKFAEDDIMVSTFGFASRFSLKKI
jgi:hypothetical protein